MCFRKLEQDVPGWDQMLKDVSKSLGMTNSEQLGARLIGRWKSGQWSHFATF